MGAKLFFETTNVEDIMDFDASWKVEAISRWINTLEDFKRSTKAWANLAHLLVHNVVEDMRHT